MRFADSLGLTAEEALPTYSHLSVSADMWEEPTRECLLCETKEYPERTAVFTGPAWLCEKCRAALLKVVEETEKEGAQE